MAGTVNSCRGIVEVKGKYEETPHSLFCLVVDVRLQNGITRKYHSINLDTFGNRDN